jgi:hypothetical protein
VARKRTAKGSGVNLLFSVVHFLPSSSATPLV